MGSLPIQPINTNKIIIVNEKPTIQIMNTKEDNNWQGNLNSPMREEERVVELNYELIKTIQSLQEDLQIFKDDNMNERNE